MRFVAVGTVVALASLFANPAVRAMEHKAFMAACPKSVDGPSTAQKRLYCQCLWQNVTTFDAPGADPEIGLRMLANSIEDGLVPFIRDAPTFPEAKRDSVVIMTDLVRRIMPICLLGAMTDKIKPDGTLR